jgi:hypothetical protein
MLLTRDYRAKWDGGVLGWQPRSPRSEPKGIPQCTHHLGVQGLHQMTLEPNKDASRRPTGSEQCGQRILFEVQNCTNSTQGNTRKQIAP